MADDDKKISISLDDLEVIDNVEIKDKEVAKKIKEMKDQNLEGVFVEIGTT